MLPNDINTFEKCYKKKYEGNIWKDHRIKSGAQHWKDQLKKKKDFLLSGIAFQRENIEKKRKQLPDTEPFKRNGPQLTSFLWTFEDPTNPNFEESLCFVFVFHNGFVKYRKVSMQFGTASAGDDFSWFVCEYKPTVKWMRYLRGYWNREIERKKERWGKVLKKKKENDNEEWESNVGRIT